MKRYIALGLLFIAFKAFAGPYKPGMHSITFECSVDVVGDDVYFDTPMICVNGLAAECPCGRRAVSLSISKGVLKPVCIVHAPKRESIKSAELLAIDNAAVDAKIKAYEEELKNKVSPTQVSPTPVTKKAE